jgi:hypothetical protein
MSHQTEGGWNDGGTASVLPAERARATFDVEAMMSLLDGSAYSKGVPPPLTKATDIGGGILPRANTSTGHHRAPATPARWWDLAEGEHVYRPPPSTGHPCSVVGSYRGRTRIPATTARWWDLA